MARALRCLSALKASAATRAAFPLFLKRNIFGLSIAAMFSVFVCKPHLLPATAESSPHLTTASIRAETTAFEDSTYAQFHPSHSSRLRRTPPSASAIPINWAARDNRSHERSVCHCSATPSFTRVETPRLLEMSNTGFHLADPFRCPCFSMEA